MIIETQLDQLKKISIMVATPMYGGMCTGAFSVALANLFKIAGKYGLSIDFRYLVNESLIPRARNRLAYQFLKESDCTHLVFIDADIGFNPTDVLTLALEAKAGSDRAVVCGAYPKKGIDWAQIKTAVENGAAKENPDRLAKLGVSFPFDLGVGAQRTVKLNELIKVRYAGTGFMAIRRDVFAHLDPTLTNDRYMDRDAGANGDMVTSYFDCMIDPETKTYLSEDYAFCDRVRQAGMNVWICPWIKLDHLGTYTFSGSIGDFAAAGLPVHKPD